MKSSSNQSSKSELREGQTTYVTTKDADYELGAMPEATVAEKHRGTLTDQHDMQVLGRTQELRVGNISCRRRQHAHFVLCAAQLQFHVHRLVRFYPNLYLGVYPCVRCLHDHGNQAVAILTYTVVRLGVPSSMEVLPVLYGVMSLS
jgi:hypothetical protein